MYPIYALLCTTAASVTITLDDYITTILSSIFTRVGTAPRKKGTLGLICYAAILAALLCSTSRIESNRVNFGGYITLWSNFGEVISIKNERQMKKIPVSSSSSSSSVSVVNKLVCTGAEWYSFPSHFFIPSNVQLAFVRDSFHGQLPQPFSPFSQRKRKALPPPDGNGSQCPILCLDEITKVLGNEIDQADYDDFLMGCKTSCDGSKVKKQVPPKVVLWRNDQLGDAVVVPHGGTFTTGNAFHRGDAVDTRIDEVVPLKRGHGFRCNETKKWKPCFQTCNGVHSHGKSVKRR